MYERLQKVKGRLIQVNFTTVVGFGLSELIVLLPERKEETKDSCRYNKRVSYKLKKEWV